MLVHRRVNPSIKFAGTHLYTWVERGTVRVKCLAQEHNTMTPARARTRSARSGFKRTNHEASAPLPKQTLYCCRETIHAMQETIFFFRDIQLILYNWHSSCDMMTNNREETASANLTEIDLHDFVIICSTVRLKKCSMFVGKVGNLQPSSCPEVFLHPVIVWKN